jgi:hypothetical protein
MKEVFLSEYALSQVSAVVPNASEFGSRRLNRSAQSINYTTPLCMCILTGSFWQPAKAEPFRKYLDAEGRG